MRRMPVLRRPSRTVPRELPPLALAAALACMPAAPALAAADASGGERRDGPGIRDAAAIEELLRSARLWQALEHPDEERGILLKLLAVRPDEPRALFLLGELELRTGHPEEARRALALLQAGATGGSATTQNAQRRALFADLQAMERVYTIDKARLAELRLVLRGGNRGRALALAQSLFPNGRPPGDLANEFAPLLASTPRGWQTMRLHLQQRLAAAPTSGDRLSLYEMLAQRPETLAQALRGFAELSQARDVDPDRVEEDWRHALRGLGSDEEGLAQRRRFLARYPGDGGMRGEVARIEAAQLQARHAAQEAARLQAEASDPAYQARRDAQRSLDEGRLDEAEAQLQRSLAVHPQDGEAIGLLGLLRFRQGRYDEANARFEDALRREAKRPDLAARWRDLAASSRYWGGLQHARTLRDQGQLEAAAQLVEAARPLQPGQTEAAHLLATIRMAQGRYRDARDLYDALLQNQPADARAWRGRLTLELLEGRVEAALDTAQALPARVGVDAADALDASALRGAIQAAGEGHPDASLRWLERGVGLLPREVWLRYDLAQAYRRLQLPALARQVMQEGQDQAPADPSMRYAAALVDAALDLDETALARLEAVPAADRTEGMDSLAQRMRFERALRLAREALDAGRGEDNAHWRVQALAAAGADPPRLLRLARADLSADDIDGARVLLARVQAHDEALDIEDRRNLAKLLIDAGEPRAAREQIDALAVQAGAGAAGPEGGAIAAPGGGTGEDLAQSLLLRARLDRALGDRAAIYADWRTLDSLLPPDEVTHRIEAVQLMDRDRDRGTAHAWMDELLRRHPQDPRVLLEAGRQAERDGRYDVAAAYLRAAQVESPGGATLPMTAGPVPLLVGRAEADTSPPRAAGGTAPEAAAERIDWSEALGRYALGTGAGTGPRDPSGQAGQELEAIEARRQPRIETAWMHYSRTADDGISSLHGSELPVVAVWPGGYDGHWFAQADSVHLDAGTLPAALSSSAQFGKVLALPPVPGGLEAPIDEQAHGLSLAAGWRGENRRFDLGVVGIGFPAPSLVGGWRESRSWNDTDVSAELSRRIQTGSLLAYAGAIDPSTGAAWGGVTDTSLTLRAGRDFADRWSGSTSLSVGVAAGRNVSDNFNAQWRAALERDWIRRSDFRLSAGASLSLWHYQYNESFYTFGQGGYYSPQRYISIGLPVEAEGRYGLWSYDARVVPSRSWTYEQDTPFYPTDPALQRLAGNPIHTAGPGGGPAGSVRADVEYRAAPHWTVGAWLYIDRSAYYAPTRAMIYLRYWFGPQQGPVPFPPHPVLPISLF